MVRETIEVNLGDDETFKSEANIRKCYTRLEERKAGDGWVAGPGGGGRTINFEIRKTNGSPISKLFHVPRNS